MLFKKQLTWNSSIKKVNVIPANDLYISACFLGNPKCCNKILMRAGNQESIGGFHWDFKIK
jgi:hypothetical protein